MSKLFRLLLAGVVLATVCSATTGTASAVTDKARGFTVVSPGHYAVPGGARFNNPLGGDKANRHLIGHVVRTINSMPGYKVPKGKHCPGKPRMYPSRIRIALYSIADHAFSRAIVAAHRRCVSVQVLMNSHLDANSSPSFGRMQRVLGKDRSKRSFARRCIRGCRGGSGPLHTKMFLFDTNDKIRRHAKHRVEDAVMVGSTNMTRNAAKVQWNDLFTVRHQPKMFKEYAGIFREMARDKRVHKPMRVLTAGRYKSTFFPFPAATPRTDRTLKALRSIKCTGARGGAGINGHTLLTISMHAWHGERGLRLAHKVRDMYGAGCHVQILYSFMSKEVHRILTQHTGSRMNARRTIFSDDGNDRADVYSHMKVFAAAGHVGKKRSSWVTWTGSANFSPRANHADEVMLRIPGRGVFADYRSQLDFIRRRKSSAVWAQFLEPKGGGRPPEERAASPDSGASMERVPFVTAPEAERRD